MKSNISKKAWIQPAIVSMSHMSTAQGGLGDGTPKGTNLITEAVYDGPGS